MLRELNYYLQTVRLIYFLTLIFSADRRGMQKQIIVFGCKQIEKRRQLRRPVTIQRW